MAQPAADFLEISESDREAWGVGAGGGMTRQRENHFPALKSLTMLHGVFQRGTLTGPWNRMK